MIQRGLEALAGRATWVMIAALVIGFAAPPVSDLFRPLVLPSIIMLLTVAMMQLDMGRIHAYMRRPILLGSIVVVNLIVSPIVMWLILWPFSMPLGLEQGLILMAAAPMISSSIALAIILGLDADLSVAVMVLTYAVVPVTLPAVSLWLLGLDLGVGFFELLGRLFGIIAIPALIAMAVRRWLLKPEMRQRYTQAINGFGVLFVVTFCLGIMAGLQSFTMMRPGYAAATLVAVFAANIGLQLLGILLFLGIGRREALTIGLLTGNTNLGLIMVVLADRAPMELIAYFVLGQVPIYFLPALLLPVYRRIISGRC